MGRRKINESDLAFRKEIAGKLSSAMKQRNLNQTAAAIELGISKQALSQYLREKATPQGEILAGVCAKWNITLQYRGTKFGHAAFGAKARDGKPDVFQMELFEEPQVFENERVIVKIAKTSKATLQVTVHVKKPSIV